MQECDKDGNAKEGGGYMKKDGKIIPMGKGGVSPLSGEELQKSITTLGTLVDGGEEAVSRKDALLTKAQTSTLEDAERDELLELLKGVSPTAATVDDDLGEELRRSMEPAGTVREGYNATDFLRDGWDQITSSMGQVGETVQKSLNAQTDVNLVLIKGLHDGLVTLQAVAERLDIISAQPAHAPKSAGVKPQVLQRSFGGGGSPGPGANPGDGPGEGALQKGMVTQVLSELLRKSVDGGHGGMLHGEDITVASSKFEQFNKLSPRMYAAVQAHIASQKPTQH